MRLAQSGAGVAAYQRPALPPGGSRLALGFLGVLGCCRSDAAETWVYLLSAAGWAVRGGQVRTSLPRRILPRHRWATAVAVIAWACAIPRVTRTIAPLGRKGSPSRSSRINRIITCYFGR